MVIHLFEIKSIPPSFGAGSLISCEVEQEFLWEIGMSLCGPPDRRKFKSGYLGLQGLERIV